MMDEFYCGHCGKYKKLSTNMAGAGLKPICKYCYEQIDIMINRKKIVVANFNGKKITLEHARNSRLKRRQKKYQNDKVKYFSNIDK